MKNKVDWSKIFAIQLCFMVGASVACIGTNNWLVIILTLIMVGLWFLGIEREIELIDEKRARK